MATDVRPVQKIDRHSFYDSLRTTALFKGKISQSQFNGLEAILNEWDRQGLTDKRWLSYMLATAYHETCFTLQPCEETGKGAGHDYGKKLKMGGGVGKRVPYSTPNQIYYGRGLVQITWFENYELMGKLLKTDLLNHPELALRLDVAVKIMFEGMLRGASSFGDFTGKCLEQYFSASLEDWTNARKIINGLDRAPLIGGYGKIIFACTA